MENKELVGCLVDLTQDIYEENIWNTYPQSVPDVHTLGRYLRRCSWDLGDAERLYRKMIEWRRINDINKKYYDKSPYSFKYIDAFYYGFTDKENIPIEILVIKTLSKYIEDDLEDILDFFVTKEEYMFSKYSISEKSMIIVYDFNKAPITLEMLYKNCTKLKEIFKIMDTYYAGRARKVYIINVPKIFEIGYGFIKPFIPEDTKKNTHIYSYDSLNNFLNDFQKETHNDVYPYFVVTD